MNARQDAGGWNLRSSYAGLPQAFWERAEPARFPGPELVAWNAPLAAELGISPAIGDAVNPDHPECPDHPDHRALLARFATGAWLPPGAMPIAQAYAGHQYGHGTMLGDGRAILVGEQVTPTGSSFDLHLKGAGQTPFSRRGDGRAALGPMLREYLVSEAMHALGIPTTRSLAVATTGELIPREGLRRGAVLVRTAASHIRVGTFEYAAALGDSALLSRLTEHAIARHDADLASDPDRAALFLGRVVARQARTIACWQSVGFVHGVMNTDNMAVSGETIDYGPCAFIDAFDAESVFSSIDRHGRYRYSQQPPIAQWNLARLAEALLPLMVGHDDNEARAVDRANELLGAFPAEYGRAWLALFRAKLGLAAEEDGDAELVRDLLAWMHATKADFTRTFRALGEPSPAPDASRAAWDARWRARLAREPDGGRSAPARMRSANPAVIARNHRVEEALAAAESGDLAPFEALLSALRRPFDPPGAVAHLCEPPPPGSCGYRTFCGT